MMKKLLSTIIVMMMIGSATVTAQTCLPDGQYTLAGIYPDTLVGLPCGQVNVLYRDTITAIIPVDSLYDLGPPIGTINATIDSIVVQDNTGDGIAVNGLPPGMTYVCNPPSCGWPGGTSGCILLIGTPTTVGTYNIVVEIDAYALELVPFGNPPVNLDAVDQYSIVISNNAPPTTTATSTNSTQPAPACNGTATATGGVTYQWDNNAGGGTGATATGLCAGTYNYSAIDVNGCGSVGSVVVEMAMSVEEKDVASFSEVVAIPNPFSGKTNINFNLKEEGIVNFVVIDRIGKVVYSESGEGTKGFNTIEFSAEGLTPGIYMYNMVSGVHSVTGKMTVVK